MSAAALARDDGPGEVPHEAAPWRGMRLSALLAAVAERQPDRPAFRDQPGREAWSGRPRLEWTYALGVRIVFRLAAFLAGLRLKPGSPIGVCLPNGSEVALTILAIEQAGHRPCLLPVAWPEAAIESALAATGIQAVVTQAVLGDERPAERFCAIAARSFGLRFLCAYGPDVPDGVVDLDQIVLAQGGAAAPLTAASDDLGSAGIITFGARGGPTRPLLRPGGSLVAAAVTVLIAAKIEPGDRILSLVAQDDLAGLATGLAAALVSGASLELHGLFDSPALAAALEDETPTHLVAPGSLEGALAASGVASRLASTILLHPAPTRFKARSAGLADVVDVLAFDETALLARQRDASGRPALSIGSDERQGCGTGDLLRLRRSDDGAIAFAGPAAEVRPYARPGTADAPALVLGSSEWRESGFKADVFAGVVIGVS